MKIADYAPGLTVIRVHPFNSRLSTLSDKTRRDYVGETISPEPARRDGDRSNAHYVEVCWRDGQTSIVSLARIAIATTR